MTTIVRFRALSGAPLPVTREAEGAALPATGQGLCYYLELDGTRILLDCGWNEMFDTAALEQLRTCV